MEGLSPAVVAFLRSIGLAVASSVVTFLVEFLTAGNNLPDGMVVYVPVVIFILRQLEGILDQYRHPEQNSGVKHSPRTRRVHD